MVVCLSDWQLGKADGDGVAGTIERIRRQAAAIRERIKREKPDRLVVVGMGDLVESCDGNYPSQRFTVEMDGVDVLEVFKQGAQVRIDLGEGATERVVLGDAFMALFNSHQHPTSMGPSGTPIQQMTAAQHLSNLAKVKQ
jgi:hypothetical protein